MKSIYEKALGDRFQDLHPVLQKKFRIHSQSPYTVMGKGTMTAIKGGGRVLRLFSRLGLPFALTFPERGEDIPFTIENEAYLDSSQNECVSWNRRFYFPHVTRSFDAEMKGANQATIINDDLGNGGFVTSPLSFRVTDEGGLLIRSTDIAVSLSKHKEWKVPGKMSVKATILEELDEDKGAIRIHVHLFQPLMGTILMYHGFVYTTFPERVVSK